MPDKAKNATRYTLGGRSYGLGMCLAINYWYDKCVKGNYVAKGWYKDCWTYAGQRARKAFGSTNPWKDAGPFDPDPFAQGPGKPSRCALAMAAGAIGPPSWWTPVKMLSGCILAKISEHYYP